MIGNRDTSAVFANLAAFRWRDADNVLQTAAQVYFRDASGLHPLLSGGAFTVTPNYVYGSAYSPSSVPVTTEATTCNVPGTGYTFLWETEDAGWSAVTPTAQTTAFRSPSLEPGATATATFTCTATKGSVSTVSEPVTAFAINTYAPF